MLGVGTIFQVKPRADDHWSTSPKPTLVLEAEAEAAGDPPLLEPPAPTEEGGSPTRRPRRLRIWRSALRRRRR
jgi:hypothetical protein